METGTSKGAKSDINVTPLIDVVLVLLIIFMVLTPSLLKHLSAAVPRKSDEPAAPVNESVIVVECGPNLELSVNTEPVAVESLAAKISERLRGARQKVVFFRADDAVPYGDVVRLMDVARGSGAQILAIVTR